MGQPRDRTKPLRGLLRESDLIARLGGDEFVVLLDGEADVAALSAVARKLLAVISEPLPLRGRSVWITGSCGIAMYPSDGDDAQTLLKNADAAMYQAKAGGKNSFHFYTAALAAQSALIGVSQAARLAVMLPAPKRFEKRMGSAYLADRAATVSARMGAVEVP